MNYMEMYDKVKEFLKSKGCDVEEFADLPEDVVGRIYYTESLIRLDCSSAKEALFTLLHEGGHWLSYLRYYVQQNIKQPKPEKRETYAYLYGWYIIKLLNLDITKEIWKIENE